METNITIDNITYNGTQIWIPPHSFNHGHTFLTDFRNKFVQIENIGIFKVIGMGIFADCSPLDDLFQNMMTYLAGVHYPLRVKEMAATAASTAFRKTRAKSKRRAKSKSN